MKKKFYERGIMKLAERWQKVIEQNGKYGVCPESIGPTFISPRHSIRATFEGHERQQ